MTSNKRKGTAREHNYIKMLRRKKHWAIRMYASAGSGISKQEFMEVFPDIYKKEGRIRAIDIISVNPDGKLMFHQISKHGDDISESEISVIIYESIKAHAYPILAWLEKREWKIVSIIEHGNSIISINDWSTLKNGR